MATDLFGPTMEAVRGCVDAALQAAGRPVSRSQTIPGTQSAWDDCCAGGGQLSVRLGQMYPTAGNKGAFPNQDIDPTCAPAMLAARLGIEVVRCAHTVDENANVPTAAEISSDAMGMTLDASIVFTSLMCCLGSIAGVQRWVIDRWDPKPVQGGCMGGEWQIVLALGHCGCEEAP